ncbi:hypothetical protein [Sphingomonas oryzagri]
MSLEQDRDHLNRKLRTITHCALYRKTLKLVCANEDCGHVRLLDAVPLWWLFNSQGWDDRLPGAVRHFYCSRCWKGRRWVLRPRYLVTADTPTGEQFTYPPESEWKRLVSRYRS